MNADHQHHFTRSDQLILNLAPTGLFPSRKISAHIPLQPDEIINCVLEAANIGISMVHLHACDQNGQPTYAKEIYARIINGIREHCSDIIIVVSCSGRNFREFEQRTDVLNLKGDVKPDMASLTLSSLNFSRNASVNEPEMIQRLLSKMLENDVVPEFEIFDLGMANYANYLMEKNNITSPIYANLILGNIATAQADLLSIAALTSALPMGTIWGLGGIGSSQIEVTAIAAAVAPAVRVGLEDNLWSDRKRTQLTSNISMVERIHKLAELSGRTVMPPGDLRGKLKIPELQSL